MAAGLFARENGGFLAIMNTGLLLQRKPVRQS